MKRVSLYDILRVVADEYPEAFNRTTGYMLPTANPTVVEARSIYCWLALKLTRCSRNEIADLSGVHRTSIGTLVRFAEKDETRIATAHRLHDLLTGKQVAPPQPEPEPVAQVDGQTVRMLRGIQETLRRIEEQLDAARAAETTTPIRASGR